MKIKTSELIESQLDYAVAIAEGYSGVSLQERTNTDWYTPSTNWALGGPIIEREFIHIGNPTRVNCWRAQRTPEVGYMEGPTPLIAAMRCYVASKLGEWVEITDDFINDDK